MNKTSLFREAFKGRDDVVPRYWESKRGKTGYSPLCRNEWKEGVCQKPCRNCSNADYIPLSDSLLLDHFHGRHILGVYPLLQDNTCHFIASDFDNHSGEGSPLEDVKTLYEVCQTTEIPAYFLRSKSGRGYHGYIFFQSPLPGWKARAVYFALLQEASVIGRDVELSSFDRLFPNQDELSGKGFGNLIALPFQGMAAKEGHTLFLNPATRFEKPLKDQWGALANVEKVPESTLDELIKEWSLDRRPIERQSLGIGSEKAVEKVMDCGFIRWCRDNPAEVPEPLWYALISNAVCVRPGGYGLCHELSKGHPTYNRAETDAKIHHALDASGPHTCEYIRKNGFKCKLQCEVKAPAGLALNKENGDPHDSRITVSFGESEGSYT